MAVFKTKLTKYVVTTDIFLEVIKNKYRHFVCEYDKNMLHMHYLFPRGSSWPRSYDSRIYTINSSMIITAKVSVNSIIIQIQINKDITIWLYITFLLCTGIIQSCEFDSPSVTMCTWCSSCWRTTKFQEYQTTDASGWFSPISTNRTDRNSILEILLKYTHNANSYSF